MKIIEKILMNKLQNFGYTQDDIKEKIEKLDLDIIDKQITNEVDAYKYVEVKEFSEPTVEIARTLINYNKAYIQSSIISGNVEFSTVNTSLKSMIPIVDYKLTENICIVSTTISLRLEILLYKPSVDTIEMYRDNTYEQYFSSERNKIAKEYYDAFVENGRVAEMKVKNILNMLISEYIIDEIALTGRNPRIKMYDNPEAYAENITEYRLKYINRKNNRVEFAYKPVNIKRLGANVSIGLVTNDPYVKLEEIPMRADFPLNIVSCYWMIYPDTQAEEVAIYIANKHYEDCRTYKEYCDKNLKQYDEITEQIVSQFQREIGIEIDENYIKSILIRLNPELLFPSMDIIRDCMENPADTIEPIRYRFKAISVPEDFEEKLYISIEDNLARRYKYKLTENVMPDLTRIGNKLEYTTEEGKLIQKQSVADFNVNACTAIIRRETLIDYDKIAGLLGYIYEDMEYLGTDMLPVPSIEVDFYFPQNTTNQVQMFNGTNLTTDLSEFSNTNKFYSMSANNVENNIPGTSFAIVRYVDSHDNILKENKINNLFPGTSFVPEIIPVINDVNGGEWVCSNNQYPTIIVNTISTYNVIEIKYIEKMSRVTVTFLSRDGKKIRDDVVEKVQVGLEYNLDNKRSFFDEEQNEWKLVNTRPGKLIVKEDELKNNLIIVYDIEKENVSVSCFDIDKRLIIPTVNNEWQVGKMYEIPMQKILVDSQGLSWIYEGKMPITHLVQKDQKNEIEINYNEYKLPVIVKFQTEDGVNINDDFVEYIQVGKKYIARYENEITDFTLKKWKLKEIKNKEITVSKNENENIIKIIYEPVVANVFIEVLSETGKKIVNSIQKTVQVGEEFASKAMPEIVDNYGKVWTYIEDSQTIVVSDNENQNKISIKYKPLIKNVIVKFFDDERNELIPEKSYQKQVGSLFKPDIIQKLESSDGRKWLINFETIKDITVERNNEENIVSIFYEKDMAEVTIQLVDVSGKSIKEDAKLKAQIGSVFIADAFKKIQDADGGKWGISSTEPKRLLVKENDNNFKFVYEEFKATVLVKHVNVVTNQTIIDDFITQVKLGGKFVPNVRQKILDTQKLSWKYIGDNDISLIVKENEQENIIILQYDEERAKAKVKYLNLDGKLIKDDVEYEYQIGKDIDAKDIDKVIDSNGLGWKLNTTKGKTKKIVKDENENEVVNYYEPLLVAVNTKYINDKGESIKEIKEEKLQVGQSYSSKYDQDIRDKENRLWRFEKISRDQFNVVDGENIVEVKYQPVMSKVSIMYLNKNGETIKDEVSKEYQVGNKVDFTPKEVLIDSQNRKWNFVKIDKETIEVHEDSSLNVANEFFEPKLVEGVIKIFDDMKNEIAVPIKFNAQIGGKYTANLNETYIDAKTKLGWKLPSKVNNEIIMVDDATKNIITVNCEKFMVKVFDKFVDEKGNEIIEAVQKDKQVGTKYIPEIEKQISDKSGKEWMIANEVKEIVVSENESNNIIILKYKPLLVRGYIKYQDNLGNIIAPQEEFQAQIGSEYKPEIKGMIVDSKKNKWAYNENSKSKIKISANENENIIILSYEEEKAPVIYKYKDEFNNRLRMPKKELAQIGSYIKPNIDNVIEDEFGKVWEYKSASVESIQVKDNEQENVIELIYIPLCVEVKMILKNRKGEIITNTVTKAQLGSTFKPTLDENIYDEESLMYRLINCEPKELLIKEVPIGSNEEINVFNVMYEPVYSNITTVFQDIDGNKLRDDQIIQLQVGSKYTPKLIQFVKDKKGIQWENITKQVETIRIMENPKTNIVKMTYELAKAEVLVKYKDVDGNIIKESERFYENIGTDFIPKVDEIIEDKKGCKWSFSVAEPVKITVGSINNIINLTYQEKKVPVTIRYETIGGRKIREDTQENVQEGLRYTPKKKFTVIYDNNEVWNFVEFKPSSLIVTGNTAENIMVQIYDNKAMKNNRVQEEVPIRNDRDLVKGEKIEQINIKEQETEKVNEKFKFTESNCLSKSRFFLNSSKL